MKTDRRLTRRRFLRATATLTAASLVPRWVLGGPGQIAPSDRLNVAIIGTGGQGITRDWIDACKGGPPASANFECGARLTEIVLLGVVALRVGKTVQWNGPEMKATNAPETEPLIRGSFRKGWEIRLKPSGRRP